MYPGFQVPRSRCLCPRPRPVAGPVAVAEVQWTAKSPVKRPKVILLKRQGDTWALSGSEGRLANANRRLRGRPGRPRKHPRADANGDSPVTLAPVPPTEVPVTARDSAPGPLVYRTNARPLRPAGAPAPRLLTRAAAAEYLGVSMDVLDRMAGEGTLRRVRLPLGDRDVRRVLYDREDLDQLILAWKSRRPQ